MALYYWRTSMSLNIWAAFSGVIECHHANDCENVALGLMVSSWF
ncbi:hypothetical protein BofuT4_uP097460.1 [Botrytis cinerea T4]|uniref:Uncharacterized protein n=1 Tax=Botryotinia fuckeliana (strain T4) TaxID=999810 RepID=G2YCZ0_BOTF4|nr:hypothetical protein BofuT4_uP097460.1 [Botrytis cinerea T4]